MLDQSSIVVDQFAERPSSRRKLLAAGAWAITGKGATAVLHVATIGVLARALSREDFAAYVLAFSFVSFGALLGALGLNILIIRTVAELLAAGRQADAKHAIRLTFGLAATGAVGVALAFYVLSSWLCGSVFNTPALVDCAVWMAAWIAIHSLNLVLAETFRGFHDIRSASLFGGFVHAVIFVVAAAGLLSAGGLDLRLVLQLAAGAALTNLLAGGWFALRHIKAAIGPVHPLGPCDVPKTFRTWPVLGESLPLMATSLVCLAMVQADLWIVAGFCSAEEVAIYGTAARLMFVVTMPLTIVNSVIPPRIAELHSEGKKRELERLLRNSATLSGLPALGALLFMTACSGWFLQTLLGPAYREGSTILTLLCLGQAVTVWGGSGGWVLNMTGHARLAMRINYGIFVVFVVAAFTAAPVYGAVGVAVVSGSAAALNKLALVVGAARRVGVWCTMAVPVPRFAPER